MGLSLFFYIKATPAQCPTWDSTVYYQPGEKVMYGGKAWQALTLIWYWKPPANPISWKEVPAIDCLHGSEYQLNISTGSGGSVIVNARPDGLKDTILSDSWEQFIYPSANTKVNLTAVVPPEYKFDFWYVTDINSGTTLFSTLYTKAIQLTIHDVTDVSANFSEIMLCTLLIQIPSNGSITVNRTSGGNIRTYDETYGKSVTLIYRSVDTISLTANPATGYEFVDWGDELHTSINPKILGFSTNQLFYEYVPSFDLANSMFKAPYLCNAGNHLQVKGMSRFYGKAEMKGNLDVRRSLNIYNKLNPSVASGITNEEIYVGSGTYMRGYDNYIYSPNFDADTIQLTKLQVNSTFRSDSIITERVMVDINNFPDFVFDKNYPLKTIDELEQYIQTNHRLPGMPSAEEVRDKGLDMGKLCSSLMQTIEELSIYTVSLHKRLKELEQQKTEVNRNNNPVTNKNRD
jgi:hypothetical protein